MAVYGLLGLSSYGTWTRHDFPMAAKGKPRKTPQQRRIELADVERLPRRGWNPHQIAAELGISRKQVLWDLREKLEPAWRAAANTPIEEVKGRLLDEVNDIRREAGGGLNRSIGTATTKTKRAKTNGPGGAGGASQEASERVEDLNGDPRWLKDLEWANEREAAIRGVDAAKRMELTGQDGKDLFSAMTEAAQNAISILTGGTIPGAPAGGADGEAGEADDGTGGGTPV